MKRKFFLISIGVVLFFAAALEKTRIVDSQQNLPKEVPKEETMIPVTGCSDPQTQEKPTYEVGASAGSLTSEDIKRIRPKFGTITVPKGVTKLARQIRKTSQNLRAGEISKIRKALQTWLAKHPNATPAEKKKQRDFYQSIIARLEKDDALYKSKIELPVWDWRERLPIGPVMNQGEGCNTCWAFATTDAVAASFIKNRQDALDFNSHTTDDDGELLVMNGAPFLHAANLRPSAQELLNCLPIEEQSICQSGWHGTAFHYFIYQNGAPFVDTDDRLEQVLGFTSRNWRGEEIKYIRQKYVPGKKFACAPNAGFQKAHSWDYVNYPPDRLPTVVQLKTALVKHGPLVALIRYDKCLESYRGGVFNEKNMGAVNHAVLLVGWDDEKQAWLIKNSWGEEWGEKGFAWIKYGSNSIGMFAAWIDTPTGINVFDGAP